MQFWLIITFCTAAAGDYWLCSDRLVPEPVGTFVECQILALTLIQLQAEYRLPFRCATEEPLGLELAPASVPGARA